MNYKTLCVAAFLLIMALVLIKGWPLKGEVNYGQGVLAPDEPIQVNINNASMFMHNDYFITPLADFEVQARVLSRRNYSWGRESDLSPVDLALGWGAMSDEAVYSQINIRQSNRFYYWRVQQFPIPRREIETNSANMHMIPANRSIERVMKNVRKGDLVSFKGKLVKAEAPDGWNWVSSLTRTDTGRGACELVFVEEFEIIEPD
jgi:hypothetical protein